MASEGDAKWATMTFPSAHLAIQMAASLVSIGEKDFWTRFNVEDWNRMFPGPALPDISSPEDRKRIEEFHFQTVSKNYARLLGIFSSMDPRQLLELGMKVEQEWMRVCRNRTATHQSADTASPIAIPETKRRRGGRPVDLEVQERDNKMIEDYEKNADYDRLCERFRVSIDTARKVISKARKAGKLPSNPGKNSRQS